MDNIFPNRTNDKFDIKYVQALVLSADVIKSSTESGRPTVIEKVDDTEPFAHLINNIDGGFASAKYLTILQQIEGGFAASTYFLSQKLEGGNSYGI